ncbi:MAG: hypothetical protein JHD16_13615 [Solirubrobacteraceae bacterium]|nr:hypothetical protein [Solirubrobacteraceae bacterium]
MRRITTAFTTLWIVFFAGTSSALAQESGAGQLHATEKLITQFGLGLIIAFPIFVWAMSRLQAGLEKRKDRKKAAYRKSKGSAAWKGGW